MLPAITATLQGPTCCRSSVALLAIAATLRGPARCCSSVARTLASCSALPASVLDHHCNVARSCSVAPPPAIAAVAAELYTFDVSRTFVGRPLDFHPRTFVR
ncbi:unnamed protein product [Sphagnum balticum]